MGLIKPDDGWRLPDELWQQMEPLLPARKAHPLGCHNPRVSDRAAMNAILFVLRTGAQWNSLNATGISARAARPIGAFRNGCKRACSRSFGGWACSICRHWTESTGPGWLWMAR